MRLSPSSDDWPAVEKTKAHRSRAQAIQEGDLQNWEGNDMADKAAIGNGAERVLRCGNCGGDVTFSSPGTLVVVCPHCSWSSYRTDIDLETIGKVATTSKAGHSDVPRNPVTILSAKVQDAE